MSRGFAFVVAETVERFVSGTLGKQAPKTNRASSSSSDAANRTGDKPDTGQARPPVKRLPLDRASVHRQEPFSVLHPPLRPARVFDAVPADYRGNLFYRIVEVRPFLARNRKRYVQMPKEGPLDEQPGQRLCRAWPIYVAQGAGSELFTSSAILRPQFRRLKGTLMAAGKKPFPEYTYEGYPLVSARVRDVLEQLEPGTHLFIPIDLPDDEGTPRLYVFFAGVTHRPSALAVAANGMEIGRYGNGSVAIRLPKGHQVVRLDRPGFYYLNGRIVGSAHLFVDGDLGFIFSQNAVERLGDILDPRDIFMPVGIVDEPIPETTGRYTRDGKVERLA